MSQQAQCFFLSSCSPQPPPSITDCVTVGADEGPLVGEDGLGSWGAVWPDSCSSDVGRRGGTSCFYHLAEALIWSSETCSDF